MRSKRRIVSTAGLLAASTIALNLHVTALAGTISALSPASVSVCAGGTAVQFGYTESDQSVTVTATSGSTSIATVTPSSMKGSGHFNVHGQSAGTTSIALSDGAGGSGSEPVTVNGPITISPSIRSLAFSGANVSGTQPVTISVSDPGPATTVTAAINSNIAVFSNGQTTAQAATSGGVAQFTIVPVGSTSSQTQTATVSFTDLSTCASTTQNNITVSVTPGSLAVTSPANNPLSLTFAGPNAASQPIKVTDYNYAGNLSAALGTCNPTACANIATVTPGSTTAPGAANSTAFTVQPKGLGNATVTLTGSTTQTVKVLVNGASLNAVGGSPVTFSTGTGTGINGAATGDLTSSAITVSGSIQTSGTGSGSVYIGTPDDITSGSGTLQIQSLKYNCTLTGTGTNQGASNLGTIQLQANSISSPCLSFGSSQFSALSFNLNFTLNQNAANALPAGSYSSPAGFTLYISAT